MTGRLCGSLVVFLISFNSVRAARAGEDFAGSYIDHQEQVFGVSAPLRLEVTTLRTAVNVRGWDRPEVRLTLERQAHDQHTAEMLAWHVERQGQTITVDVRRPFGGLSLLTWNQVVVGRLAMSVPSWSALTVHTGAGSIESRNVSGGVVLQSVRGSISVDGTLTMVEAYSRSGSISVRADRGSTANRPWTVETIRGAILIEGADALLSQVHASTRRGSVTVRTTTAGKP